MRFLGAAKAARSSDSKVDALARFEYEREGNLTHWGSLPESVRVGYRRMAQETIDFLDGLPK